MKTDVVFKSETMKYAYFTFDSKVVNVFDDMVVRFVPHYPAFQRMIAEIATNFAKPDTTKSGWHYYSGGKSAGRIIRI